MEDKNKFLSHTDIENNGHNDASFVHEVKKPTSEEKKAEKEKLQFEKEKKKLELLIEKSIEEADRIEEKQKNKEKKNVTNNVQPKNVNNKTEDTSIIPTISLKDYVNDKQVVEKDSFFKKLKKWFDDRKRIKEENAKAIKTSKELEINNKKLQKEAQKQEKIRLAEEKKAKLELAKAEKKNNVKNVEDKNVDLARAEKERLKQEKLEKQKFLNEEKTRKKQELLEKRKLEKEARKQEKVRLAEEKKAKLELAKAEKERLKLEKTEKAKILNDEKLIKKKEAIEEKKAEKERIALEKNRVKEEKKLLTSESKDLSSGSPADVSKEEKKKLIEEAKKLAKEKKAQEKLKKEEARKLKLKEKYDEEVKRKKAQEEKDILIISKKRERLKKQKEEKEQARRERKEKAVLIKKAQEESKQKARSERKTFKEKVNDWYNNLSFVKDRKNRRELQRQTLLIDFDGADAVRSEEKIMYKYVAKNNETGKVETGMFAAFSKLDVHSFLLAEGYEVYEITPQKNLSGPLARLAPKSKLKAAELDFFLTQLSTFLRSGITLVESVKILSKQTKKTTRRNLYKSVIYELTMGENFSEALAKQGNMFPRLLINMVKTSELTGDLPETLDDMADYYRETEKTKKQMISAMTYPVVVLTFAVVILVFIMVSVIPQFVDIYSDMGSGLPAITVAVIKLSDFLQANWIFLLIGVIIFIIVFLMLFHTIKVFKSVVQSLIMNVPIIGKIIIYNEVTMFTKTFASLLNHNVYITDCMEVLSKITNNEVYKMMIFDTITNLAKGEAVSNSFKNHWAFPTVAYEMILTGERTGQLGTMMDKVANYYQEQHKNAVGQIKAFIEPVMIILLASIVGVVLLSVVLPMFDMYQNIGMG